MSDRRVHSALNFDVRSWAYVRSRALALLVRS